MVNGHGYLRNAGTKIMRAAALLAGFGLAASTGVAAAATQEVLAEPPSDLIVTVYRAPFRNSGSFDLNDLNGFALVTETRLLRLPRGCQPCAIRGCGRWNRAGQRSGHRFQTAR